MLARPIADWRNGLSDPPPAETGSAGEVQREEHTREGDGRRSAGRDREGLRPEGLTSHSNAIPVSFEIRRRSSTTGITSGIPDLRRTVSASRSGSPGISGPFVPGAGFVLRKVR